MIIDVYTVLCVLYMLRYVRLYALIHQDCEFMSKRSGMKTVFIADITFGVQIPDRGFFCDVVVDDDAEDD